MNEANPRGGYGGCARDPVLIEGSKVDCLHVTTILWKFDSYFGEMMPLLSDRQHAQEYPVPELYEAMNGYILDEAE